MARSPEGVSATDVLDRAEDGGVGDPTPRRCDCNCDCVCECERECAWPPLWAGAGVTGPAGARGGIGGGGGGGGGGGDTGADETRGGVWTAEDVRAINEGEPTAALET